MAIADIQMPTEFLKKISDLGKKTDEICEKALEAGGEVMLKKVKGSLSSVIGTGTKSPSRSTGELEKSLGLSGVKVDRNGNHNIKVGFAEPRSKQTAAKGKRSYHEITNAMIANTIEYGRSGQPAKPFLKPAKSQGKKACQEAMKNTFEEEVKKL